MLCVCVEPLACGPTMVAAEGGSRVWPLHRQELVVAVAKVVGKVTAAANEAGQDSRDTEASRYCHIQ